MADAPEVQADSGAVSNDDPKKSETVAKAAEFDVSSPEIQALILQATESATKDFKKKVDEFRTNNIELSKQLEQWKATGLDPEKAKKISENLAKNEEARLVAEGKIDDLLQLRTEPMRRDFQTKLDAAYNELNEARNELKRREIENFDLKVSNQVSAACSKFKDLQPGADEMIVKLAREVWRIEDNGEVVPRHPENGARWISKDLKNDISFEEWIDELRTKYGYFFMAPTGAPVRGGPGKVSMDYLQSLPPVQRLEEARRLGMTK